VCNCRQIDPISLYQGTKTGQKCLIDRLGVGDAAGGSEGSFNNQDKKSPNYLRRPLQIKAVVNFLLFYKLPI
jgi:hypothetical protein